MSGTRTARYAARQPSTKPAAGTRTPAAVVSASRAAFDAALILEADDGSRGVIGIAVKHHEHLDEQEPPPPEQLDRFRAVARVSKAFKRGAVERLVGEPLQQIWQHHLLALSMVTERDPAERWNWAKLVVVYPARNPSFSEGVQHYRALLHDPSTFGALTLEHLLRSRVLPAPLAESLEQRYLW